MRTLTAILLMILLSGLSFAADEDFVWSWEDGDDTQAEAAPAKVDRKSDEGDEGEFAWSWDEDKADVPDESPVLPGSVKQTPGIDLDEYNELREENLALRRRIELAAKEAQRTSQRNQVLAAELRGLEETIGLSVVKIRELEKAKAAAPPENLDKLMDLESELSKAEIEKSRLGMRLIELQKEVKNLKVAVASKPAPKPVPRPMLPTVKPGSALFESAQKQNLLLKNKLVEIEEARQKAVTEQAKASRVARVAQAKAEKIDEENAQLEEELEFIKESEKEQRRSLSALINRIPRLERDLDKMSRKVKDRDNLLAIREHDLSAFRRELDLRESRIIKAERMAAVLAQAQKEVRRVSDNEKRDMHYNMGAVYVVKGQYEAAEREYLTSLRIDPSDAEVHYNLGILYDDNLSDKRRAARHYKRYLKLNPHASDYDQVRGWLMKIEMSKH